ncbi:zinc finger protein 862-like [Scomber scombrus]|uniref:Zinc finger protein 862-like n=1 Tax=Scomber scombrus TaxID=13677 RepID=A0AAV1P4I8_SCOSC
MAEARSCLRATQTLLTKYKTRPSPKLKACMDQNKNDNNNLTPVMKVKFKLLDHCQSLQSHRHEDSPSYKVDES